MIFYDKICNLFVRIADHLFAALRRKCIRCAGIKEAEKVIYFGYGTDCRTRVAACSLLLNCNYGAQPFNVLHFRPLKYTDKLSRISGKGLHIATLSFRIDGVKCKRGFTTAGESCHHDKAVARN